MSPTPGLLRLNVLEGQVAINKSIKAMKINNKNVSHCVAKKFKIGVRKIVAIITEMIKLAFFLRMVVDKFMRMIVNNGPYN